MSAPGRPPLPPSLAMILWIMVELMRDRKDKPSLSIRGGAARLAKRLPRDFGGAKALTSETIRRHYKAFQTSLRRSNSDAERHQAEIALKIARARRVLLGWDCDLTHLTFGFSEAEIALAEAIVLNTKSN